MPETVAKALPRPETLSLPNKPDNNEVPVWMSEPVWPPPSKLPMVPSKPVSTLEPVSMDSTLLAPDAVDDLLARPPSKVGSNAETPLRTAESLSPMERESP